MFGHFTTLCMKGLKHVISQNHSAIAKFKILKRLKGKKIRNYLPSVNLQKQRCSVEKGVHRNFTKFTGKHLSQSLRPATLSKKRLWHRCFTVNFAKFLRTPFLQNTSERLLLNLLLRCWFSEAAAYRCFSK